MELLISLLNSTKENAVGVMEAIQIIQEVAATELRVQDFDIRVDETSRFGE